jgi:hypothetical protein
LEIGDLALNRQSVNRQSPIRQSPIANPSIANRHSPIVNDAYSG